jgi:LysM repeat protein
MTRIVQFRRGTTSGLTSILGAPGELFVDTSLVTVVVHDGATTGGTTLARNADLNSLTSSTNFNISTLSSNVNTRITNVTSQTITTTSLTIGSSVSTLWNFAQSSNGSLYLYFNGVAKFRFDTGGTITATNDLIAVGTI